MENEARNVFKHMQDATRNEKLSKRFFSAISAPNSNYRINNSNMQNTGFILVGGNHSDLGHIIKVNSSFAKELKIEKDHLLGQRVEKVMPTVLANFHIQIISNYTKLQIELFHTKSSERKSVLNKNSLKDGMSTDGK